MPEHVSEQVVKMRADERAADDLIDRTDDIRAGLRGMRDDVQDMGRELGITDDRLAKWGKSAQRVGGQIDEIAEHTEDFRREIDRADQSVDELDRALRSSRGFEQFEAQMRGARGQVEVFGDLASRTTAFSGLASGLGQRAIGERFMLGADILDVVEAGPLFAREIGHVAERFTEATPITKGMANALQKVIPGMSSTAANLTVMGGVIGGVALAGYGLIQMFKSQESAMERSREAVRDYIERQEELNNFLISATTEDLKRQIAEKTIERDQRQKEVTENKALAASLEAKFWEPVKDMVKGPFESEAAFEMRRQGIAAALWEPVEVVGFGIVDEYTDIVALKDAADKKQIETVDKLTNDIDTLTNSLDSSAVAANDATAAQDDLNRQRADFLQDQYRLDQQAAERAETWTSEQVEARLAAIAREKTALEKQIAEYDAMAETSDWAREEAVRLRREYANRVGEEQRLLNTVKPLVEAREDEIRATADLIEQVGLLGEKMHAVGGDLGAVLAGIGDFDADAFARVAAGGTGGAIARRTPLAEEELKVADKRLDILRDFRDDAVKIEADHALDVKRDAEDFHHDRALDLAEHYRDLADLDTEFYQDRADLLEDISEDLADIDADRLDEIKDRNKEQQREAQDHARRLVEIERDMREGIEDAAAQLDARTVVSLKKQGVKRLRDEKDQYDLEQARREEDFQDRLDELDELRNERLQAGQQALIDLQEQHEEERQQTIADWNRRLAEEDYQREVALQRQREDWFREDQERQQVAAARLQELGYFTNNMLSMETAYYDSSLDLTDSFLNGMVDRFGQAFSDINTLASNLGAQLSNLGSQGGQNASDLGALMGAIGGLS